MRKIRIVIGNNQGKKRISKILEGFKKGTPKYFKKRKYNYANRLIKFKKSDLESTKADLEFAIDNERTLAAFFAVTGTVITAYLLLENYNPVIPIVSTIIFAGFGCFLYFDVSGKIALLHIVKIALAKKSEIKNDETPNL